MVNKLVDRGVLERNAYVSNWFCLVIISERSVQAAKENKEKRGKWTASAGSGTTTARPSHE
jgi:hypothetical protein